MTTPLPAVLIDLVRAETLLYNRVEDALAAQGLESFGRLQFLAFIEDRGTCRVQDIADDIGITIGATSKAVDRIERDGLVRRRANPEDGRSQLISVTPKGRAARRAAAPVVEQELGAVTAALPAAVAKRLAADLAALHRALR